MFLESPLRSTCGLLANILLFGEQETFLFEPKRGLAASLCGLKLVTQVASVSQITCKRPLKFSRNTSTGDSYCTDSKCVVIKNMYTSLIYVLQEKQMPHLSV